MRLYRAFDVPHLPGAEVFRQSRLVASVGPVLMGLLVAGVAWLGLTRDAPPLFWAIPALFALVGLGLLGVARASFRSSNWLVRQGPDGLLIQFRSHLNAHLPAQDETVVFVPTSEIASVHETRERRRVPSSRGGTETRRLVYLDVHLKHRETGALAAALEREQHREAPRRGLSRTRYLHHPVRLPEPDRIRVLWRSTDTWIQPGLDRLLARLGERVPVGPLERIEQPAPGALEGAAFDAYVVELARSGERVKAVMLLRQRHGYGLRRARQALDELLARPAAESESPSGAA